MWEFDVFDDPSLSTDTTGNISQVATDTNCDSDSRKISSDSADKIRNAYNLCQVNGWALSNLRYTSV
jgi:hypothetical protein